MTREQLVEEAAKIYIENPPPTTKGVTLYAEGFVDGYTLAKQSPTNEPVVVVAKPPRKAAAIHDKAVELYNLYPNKQKRQTALVAITKALKIADFETLKEAVSAYAVSPQGKGNFCPLPASWFNAHKWLDDRAKWQKASAGDPVQKPRPVMQVWQEPKRSPYDQLRWERTIVIERCRSWYTRNAEYYALPAKDVERCEVLKERFPDKPEIVALKAAEAAYEEWKRKQPPY